MKKVLAVFFVFLLLSIPVGLYLYSQRGAKPLPTSMSVPANSIEIVSEYAGFTLEKSRYFNELYGYLEHINFWNPGIVFDPASRAPVTAKQLKIILVSSDQEGGKRIATIDGQPETLSSYSTSFDDGIVTIKIFVNTSVISAVGLTVDDGFNVAILEASYLLTQTNDAQWQQQRQAAQDLINTWYKQAYINVKPVTSWLQRFKQFVVPRVYAQVCMEWTCGTQATENRCSNTNASCVFNSDCTVCSPTPGCNPATDPYCTCSYGTCNTVSGACVLPEFREESTTCATGCPAGKCVKDVGVCSCVLPTATPGGGGGGGGGPTATPGGGGGGPGPTAVPTVPASTPLPTATSTPIPASTSTPIPTATSTPLPTATRTPTPTNTPTSTPTPTRTPTPTPTNTPTPTPTPAGTIQSRAVQVDPSGTSCADIRAVSIAAAEINNMMHRFTVSSANQPAPKTQSGANYVTFTALGIGSYTLDPVLPSADWVLARACWSIASGPNGEGFSAVLGNNQVLTYDIGYILGNPWVQSQGGDVYAAGVIKSYIPGVSPRVFSKDGAGGYPGVVTYGTSYDFDGQSIAIGGTLVSSKNWLANETRTPQDYYDYFYNRFGAPTATDNALFPNLLAVAKPASRATPYYINGDIATTGNWVIPAGESVIFIVNGDITIGGKVTITPGGFASFIAHGDISIASSVGTTFGSTTSVLDGIYVTATAGTFATGTSTAAATAKLVGKGMFVAGNFLLQRDLDIVNANTTAPAELFIYDPQLLFTMPDEMKELPILWQEVVP